jgi:hypothetical protein
MRLTRENQELLCVLNLLESRLLLRIFRDLLAQYRLKPGEVDPKTASAWYSTRGSKTAGMSEEETREWLEQLHQFRTGQLARIDQWIAQLAQPPPDGCTLRIAVDAADSFLSVLNDHRLRMATCHGIGQAEMDLQSPLALAKLPLAQQNALFEIHVLAWLIEQTLGALTERQA